MTVYVCGMGWSESRIDFSDNPDGKPRVDHIDPMEMVWDRDARERNLSDATRIWRARRVPLDEAKAMFPGFTKEQLNCSWSNVSTEADLKRQEAVVSSGGPQITSPSFSASTSPRKPITSRMIPMRLVSPRRPSSAPTSMTPPTSA
jgi:hypothetical protein